MFKKWLENNSFTDISFGRLFEKAENRDYWNRFLGKKQIENAEKYLGYEWPMIRATQFMEFHKSGDRLAQETPFFARRYALLDLVLGELAEYKGRFMPDIVDGIFAICEETYWGLSAHSSVARKYDLIPSASEPYIDLIVAETGELISVIYHIFYDEIKKFCPELLERIEYELDRRIVTPYINHCDYIWMGHITASRVNNWNPWIISNLVTVFLLTDIKRTTLERGLEKMFGEINVYYSGLPEDGGCDEGSLYWTKAAAKLFAFCDVLYITSGGKIDFFDSEKLKRIMHYVIKSYIGNKYYVNFADGSARRKSFNVDYPVYGFGKRTGDKEFCAFAKTLKDERESDDCKTDGIKAALFSLIFAKEIDLAPDFVPKDRYILPDIQNAFMREGDWYCATKGGHNREHHNHNDVGSIIVYNKNEPVLIDAGVGVYTKFTFSKEHRYKIWTMRSLYHNVPEINGCEQPYGENYRADSFEVNGNSVSVSFAGAYPDNTGVKNVTRTVDTTENGITLCDSFEFENDKNTVNEHFLSVLKPKITEGGVVLGGKYILKTDLPCKIEWVDFNGDKKLRSSWDTDGVYRICLSANYTKNAIFKIELRSI